MSNYYNCSKSNPITFVWIYALSWILMKLIFDVWVSLFQFDWDTVWWIVSFWFNSGCYVGTCEFRWFKFYKRIKRCNVLLDIFVWSTNCAELLLFSIGTKYWNQLVPTINNSLKVSSIMIHIFTIFDLNH